MKDIKEERGDNVNALPLDEKKNVFGEKPEEEINTNHSITKGYYGMLQAIKLKLKLSMNTLISSILIILTLSLFIEKNYGIIHVISTYTQTHRFYLALLSAGLLATIGSAFVDMKSWIDFRPFVLHTFIALCMIIFAFLLQGPFSQVVSRVYNDINEEISPPLITKVYSFLLFILVFFLGHVVGSFLVGSTRFLIEPRHSDFVSGHLKDQKNIISFFIFAIISNVILVFVYSFLYLLIIAIGSPSFLPHIDPAVETLTFGYILPLMKAFVSTLIYRFFTWLSDLQNWDHDKRAKQFSGG